jgi:hypothetical protein
VTLLQYAYIKLPVLAFLFLPLLYHSFCASTKWLFRQVHVSVQKPASPTPCLLCFCITLDYRLKNTPSFLLHTSHLQNRREWWPMSTFRKKTKSGTMSVSLQNSPHSKCMLEFPVSPPRIRLHNCTLCGCDICVSALILIESFLLCGLTIFIHLPLHCSKKHTGWCMRVSKMEDYIKAIRGFLVQQNCLEALPWSRSKNRDSQMTCLLQFDQNIHGVIAYASGVSVTSDWSWSIKSLYFRFLYFTTSSSSNRKVQARSVHEHL